MVRYVPLVLFLALVVGGGSLIGVANTPGGWYETLEKPFFNPPDWLFAPVWTVLYVMIAIAGWRIWRLSVTGGAMTAWWLQLGLNFLWSPVFFTLQHVGAALLVVVALLAAILAFIALARLRDALAAWLFVPYALWVGYATVLNAAIWILN